MAQFGLSNFSPILLNYNIIFIKIFFILHVTCSDENELFSPSANISSKLFPAVGNKSQSFFNENENENKNANLISEIKIITNQSDFVRNSNILFPNTEEFERIVKTKDFGNIPGLRPDDNFETWIPPLEIQRDIPAYLAGFSYNNEPIWVLEAGKWKLDKYISGSWRARKDFEKYFRYIAYLAIRSQAIKSTEEHPINTHILLYDYEGLGLDVVLNTKYLPFIRKLTRDYRRHLEIDVSKIIAINVSPLSEILINFVIALFSRILGRLEVYGINKAVWAPELLKTFPSDQLPEWYGGKSGFKPVYVIG